MPDPASQSQGIASRVAAGEELTAETPDEAAFRQQSLANKGNQAALASKFPDKVTTFVGGQRVDLAPDVAQKAIAQGSALLPRNQDLHVQRPDGSWEVVPADQVNQKLADSPGARIGSAQEHHQADLAAQLGTGVGSGMAAVGLGAARGFSTVLGGGSISDELVGFSPELQEKARYLQEHRSVLSGAGEALGMLGQAAVMPVGGIAGLAERGVASVAGEGLGGRLLTQAAKAAVENVQLEHAHLVGEESLGAPPLTAEKYAAEELGALWQGAAAGAVGAGLAEGIGAGGRALKGALTKTSTATDIDSVAEKTFGYKPKDGGVGEAVKAIQEPDAAAAMKPLTDKELREQAGVTKGPFFGGGEEGKRARAIRAAVANVEDVRADAVRTLSADMDALMKKTESITEEAKGVSKREHLKASVKSPLDPADVQAHAMDSLQDVRDDIAEMAANSDQFGNGGALKRIDQQLRAHEKDMVAAVERGDHPEMYAVLDDTKRTIGGWARKFQAAARSGDPLAREQAQEVFTRLGDVDRGGGIYERLRTNLEDASTWGKAAEGQRAINAAWTEYIGASKQLGRAASVTSQVGENNFGRALYAVDPAKMERYVAGLVNPNNDLAHKAMADYISSAKNLASAIDEHFELSGAKKAAVGTVKDNAAKMASGLADIGDKLSKVNQIHAMAMAGETGAKVAVGILGHAIGGPIGGVAGMGVSGLANPGKNIVRLAQLENVVRKFDAKLDGAISRFFARSEASAGGPSVVARAKSAASSIKRGIGAAQRQATREEFEKRAEQVRKLGDPVVLNGHLAAHQERMQGMAPQTAQALSGTAAGAVAYLTSQLPHVDPADALTGKPGVPAFSEMAAFNLKAAAVEHPQEVMDDLARGRVTVEQVDAIKNAYPEVYRELQTKVQQTLIERAQAGKPVSFQQRVALGILLDIEADPSLTKPAMGHAMATFAMPEQPADKGPGGSKGGPSVRGKSATTPGQRLESEPGAI